MKNYFSILLIMLLIACDSSEPSKDYDSKIINRARQLLLTSKETFSNYLETFVQKYTCYSALKQAALEVLGSDTKANEWLENKIQELADKQEQLPKDIQWHMIGHVQRNKVKYMAAFVSMVHAIDSLKLLMEIGSQKKFSKIKKYY